MPGKKGKSGGSRPNSGAKKGPELVSAHFLILTTHKEWLEKQGNQNETVRGLIQEAIDNNLRNVSNFTKEQAIKIYESGVYNDMTAKQIVDFQLFESKLCMPFGVFHGAVEEMLGRPVYTHEFSEPENLRKEYLAGKTFIIHP